MAASTARDIKLNKVVGRKRLNLTPGTHPAGFDRFNQRDEELDWQEVLSPELGRLVLELVAEVARGTRYGAVKLIIAEGRVVNVKAEQSYKVP